MSDIDPRTLGFNYSAGWGEAVKPPIYLEAMRLSHKLNQVAKDIGNKAWSLEMAIRNVRLATTGVEKACAVLALKRELENFNQI